MTSQQTFIHLSKIVKYVKVIVSSCMVEQKYIYFLWNFMAKKQALQQGNQFFFKCVEINGSAVFTSFFFFFVVVELDLVD